MLDLDKIRSELTTYTQAITLSLNLLGLNSQGKVERYMESHGDDLRDIKASLNWITAKFQVREGSTHGERSILSSYVGDDKEVWKIFRRELIQDGFSSQVLKRHKETIKKYVVELGARGVLDDAVPDEIGQDCAPQPAIHNEAVLNGESVSSPAIGLGERAASNDASQVEEGGEVDSDNPTVAVPEDLDQCQPSPNPISVQDHPSTTWDPQVERESDFHSDEVVKDAEAENYSGSEDKVTPKSGEEVFSESKLGATQERSEPETLVIIGSEPDDDSDLDSDSNYGNRHIETPNINAQAYTRSYASEIQDENKQEVTSERGGGGLDGSVDCKERPSSDEKTLDAMLNPTSGLAFTTMKTQEGFPGTSRSPNSPYLCPNWEPTSDQDEDEPPAPLENGKEKNSKQDEHENKKRSAASTSSTQNESIQKRIEHKHTPSQYRRPISGPVQTTPLAKGVSVTLYEPQNHNWEAVQTTPLAKGVSFTVYDPQDPGRGLFQTPRYRID